MRRDQQQGVVLIIALIALVAMSLAAIALVRTVDTSNVVSGNVSFNEAVIQMADLGAEAAYADIKNQPAFNASSCQNVPANCPGYFYLTMDPADSIDQVTKLPKQGGATLNWSNLTPVTLPGVTGASGYSYQYVIERMCRQTGAPSFVKGGAANCTALPVYDPTTGIKANVGRLFFRVTVQVTGPRNTRGLAQYFYTTPFEDAVQDSLP